MGKVFIYLQFIYITYFILKRGVVMTKKEHKEEHKHTKECCSANVWMYICIGLGIAFLIALVFAITNATKTGIDGIGTENAGTIIKTLVKEGQGIDANVTNVTEENGLYKVDLTASGQSVTFYLTLDGKQIIIGQGIYKVQDVLDNIAKQKADENSAVYALPDVYPNAETIGSKDSKVTLLEFVDFQCTVCGIVFGSPWAVKEYSSNPQASPLLGTTQKIEADAKAGKFLFKQIPVAFLNQESIDAENAALCAGEQDKYWEMHNALFESQSKNEGDGTFSKSNLKIIGQKIDGLDTTKFNMCVDNDTYVSQINVITANVSNTATANSTKLFGQKGFGTPTFYIVLDSAKYTESQVSTAAKLGSYNYVKTTDGKNYIIGASYIYDSLTKVIDALQ